MISYNFKVFATNETFTVIASDFDKAVKIMKTIGYSTSQWEYIWSK